jgi:transposase
VSSDRSASRVQWPRRKGPAGDRTEPFRWQPFIFRSKRGDYFKAIYWDGTGLWLLAKRLEKGRFVWPPIVDGAMTLTPAQLAVLIEAMDWRRTVTPPAPIRPVLV